MLRARVRVALVGILAFSLAMAGPALADTTVRLTFGPVPIPKVPVKVCVSQTDIPAPVDKCVTTPATDSVSLTVKAHVETPEPVLVPPTITPIACPSGIQGVAAQVFTGSADTTISGFVKVKVNGKSTKVPVPVQVAGPGQTLTVFACAGLS